MFFLLSGANTGIMSGELNRPYGAERKYRMKLTEVLQGLSCTPCTDTREIGAIVYDSRQAAPDALFVALNGTFSDGHQYARSAYEKGARAFLLEHPVDLPEDALQIITGDTRGALMTIGGNFYRHPERELKLVGITGTKGKTSTTGMLGSCLNDVGIRCGTIGTAGAIYNGKTFPTANTTPESIDCLRLFRDMADAGCRVVVMEVSSLGLKSQRVKGLTFDAAVFTNISPDHIGGYEHESYEEYAGWKKQLFRQCKAAVLNADDPFSQEIIGELQVPHYTFGLERPADFWATDIRPVRAPRLFGVAFSCQTPGETYRMQTAMPGRFSVYNALAALAVCHLLGISLQQAANGLAKAKVVGRNDCLDVPAEYDVIIDYAHNKRSFEALMDTLEAYEHNRLITVFGAVGSRAQLRRKEVGTVSGTYADLSVITTDDPNFEDPVKIAEEIAGYVKAVGGEYVIVPDREEAVFYALDHAKKGDIVLLLGKGQETEQKICGKLVHYSDYESVWKYFSKKR